MKWIPIIPYKLLELKDILPNFIVCGFFFSIPYSHYSSYLLSKDRFCIKFAGPLVLLLYNSPIFISHFICDHPRMIQVNLSCEIRWQIDSLNWNWLENLTSLYFMSAKNVISSNIFVLLIIFHLSSASYKLFDFLQAALSYF